MKKVIPAVKSSPPIITSANISEAKEKELEVILKKAKPGVPWSVKNQARMHSVNGDKPYVSSKDAIARWPELPTCVAVKLTEKGDLELIAPKRIGSLINLEVRMNPDYSGGMSGYRERLAKKNWGARWPKLKIFDEE